MSPIGSNAYRIADRSDAEAGYSLIELLVTLSIVALLVALVPAVSIDTLRHGSAKNIHAQITADLKYSRIRARNEGKAVSVTILDNGSAYKIGGTSSQTNLPEGFVLSYKPFRDLQEASVSSLQFYPEGSSTGGVLLLSNGNNERKFSIHWLTGAIHDAG